MKNLLIILFLTAPFTSISQCNLWLGDSADSVTAIVKTAEHYLQVKMREKSLEGSKNFVFTDTSLFVSQVYVTMNVSLNEDEKTNISSISITGTAEAVKRLYEYLQARVKDCSGFETFETGFRYNKNKVLIGKKKSRSELDLHVVQIIKDNWAK